MDRFGSVIRFSMSKLHAATANAWVMAALFKVRMAANRIVGLGEDRNSCSTVKTRSERETRNEGGDGSARAGGRVGGWVGGSMGRRQRARSSSSAPLRTAWRHVLASAGMSSLEVTSGRLQIARAASNTTISLRCRRHCSSWSNMVRFLRAWGGGRGHQVSLLTRPTEARGWKKKTHPAVDESSSSMTLTT